MTKSRLNNSILLFLLMIFSIGGLVLLKVFFIEQEKHADYNKMKSASELAQKWFDIVIEKKDSCGIHSDAESSVINSGLIGNDYTLITTTLGSLSSKELSTNPDFAAVIYKMLSEANLDSNSVIGLTISGSFPSLAISTLAAAKTLGAKVIILSSLGASSYGANQPEATWIDMESWLRNDPEFDFRTKVLTLGAENDNGGGLMDEAVSLFYHAIERNGYDLFLPNDLNESIVLKTSLLKRNNIDLLINIGGNQAAVGACAHAVTIPNGYHDDYITCDDEERGIIARMSEAGVPFIHLLNIKDLAVKVGIPLEPGNNYGNAYSVYYMKQINIAAVIVLLLIIMSSLLFIKLRNKTG